MGNFDCTQFVTFDMIKDKSKEIEIIELFEKNGFKILVTDNIKPIKKEYFRKYFERFFFEIQDEEFLGEFYDWKDASEMPEKIEKFSIIINKLLSIYKVKKCKLIFTYFAEAEKTSIEEVEISQKSIAKGLLYVSPNNFEYWADNYVLVIK